MTDAVTCPSCGALNDADARECHECGSPLPEAVAQPGDDDFADDAIDAQAGPADEQSDDELSDPDNPQALEADADFESFEDGGDAAQFDGEDPFGDEDTDYALEPIDDVDEEALDEIDAIEGIEDIDAMEARDDAPDDDLGSGVDEFDEELHEEFGDEFGDEQALDLQVDADAIEAIGDEPDAEQALDQAIDELDDGGAEAGDEAHDEALEQAPTIVPQRTTKRQIIDVAPLPVPGAYETPAKITVFVDHRALEEVALDNHITYFGTALDAAAGDAQGAENARVSDGDDLLDEMDLVDEMELVEVTPEAIDHTGPMADAAIDDVDERDEAQAVADQEFEETAGLSESGADPADAEDGEDGDAAPAGDKINTTAAVDLSSYPAEYVAKNHVAIFKQHKNYTLYVLSDEPTQLNDRLLSLGERAGLNDGDVVVLGTQVAMRVDLPA